MATIKVTTFKDTGKVYTGHSSRLIPEHEKLKGFELKELFLKNDPSIQEYAGLTNGFNYNCFYFVINVKYVESSNNYCHFLLDKTKGL